MYGTRRRTYRKPRSRKISRPASSFMYPRYSSRPIYYSRNPLVQANPRTIPDQFNIDSKDDEKIAEYISSHGYVVYNINKILYPSNDDRYAFPAGNGLYIINSNSSKVITKWDIVDNEHFYVVPYPVEYYEDYLSNFKVVPYSWTVFENKTQFVQLPIQLSAYIIYTNSSVKLTFNSISSIPTVTQNNVCVYVCETENYYSIQYMFKYTSGSAQMSSIPSVKGQPVTANYYSNMTVSSLDFDLTFVITNYPTSPNNDFYSVINTQYLQRDIYFATVVNKGFFKISYI